MIKKSKNHMRKITPTRETRISLGEAMMSNAHGKHYHDGKNLSAQLIGHYNWLVILSEPIKIHFRRADDYKNNNRAWHHQM